MTETEPNAGADRLMICSSLAPGSFVRRRGTNDLNSTVAWRSVLPGPYTGRTTPDPDTAIILPKGTHLVLWVEAREAEDTVGTFTPLVLLLLSGNGGFAYVYAGPMLVPVVATGRSD